MNDWFCVFREDLGPLEPGEFEIVRILCTGGPQGDGFFGVGPEAYFEIHNKTCRYPIPSGPGIWIWEGTILEDEALADTWPFEFKGEYRRPTENELLNLALKGRTKS